MTCSECKQNMYYLPETEDGMPAKELRAHLSACAECRQEYDELMHIVRFIRQGKEMRAPEKLQENILRRLSETRLQKTRAPKIRKIVKSMLKIASFLIIAAAISFLVSQNTSAAKANTLITSALNAMRTVQTLFIELEMRTKPAENFGYLNVEDSLVLHKVYKDFSGKTKWRADKGGRIAVMNGDTTRVFVPDMLGIKIPGNDTNVLRALAILLEPEKILEQEQMRAQQKGSKIKTGKSEKDLFLSVTSKAEGIFIDNVGKNSSIEQSDNRREYVFDKETRLLKSLKIFLLGNEKEILILNIKNIRYNTPLDSEIFTLTLPEGMQWTEYQNPQANSVNSQMSPKQAAFLFLQDLSKGDFETHKELWNTMIHAKDLLYEYFGGLEIISVGEAFQSGTYPGYYVPYEIKLKNGQTKKHRLTISNNNPGNVWQVEGGL